MRQAILRQVTPGDHNQVPYLPGPVQRQRITMTKLNHSSTTNSRKRPKNGRTPPDPDMTSP
jgi:hypothetical protein